MKDAETILSVNTKRPLKVERTKRYISNRHYYARLYRVDGHDRIQVRNRHQKADVDLPVCSWMQIINLVWEK